VDYETTLFINHLSSKRATTWIYNPPVSLFKSFQFNPHFLTQNYTGIEHGDLKNWFPQRALLWFAHPEKISSLLFVIHVNDLHPSSSLLLYGLLSSLSCFSLSKQLYSAFLQFEDDFVYEKNNRDWGPLIYTKNVPKTVIIIRAWVKYFDCHWPALNSKVNSSD